MSVYLSDCLSACLSVVCQPLVPPAHALTMLLPCSYHVFIMLLPGAYQALTMLLPGFRAARVPTAGYRDRRPPVPSCAAPPPP